MKVETNTPILEMLTVTQAARELAVCDRTLFRRLVASGAVPDAVLTQGGKKSPLFVHSRLNELKKLINP